MPVTPSGPPSAEPVALQEAKAWLRLDTSDDDVLLAMLIPAARQAVERWARLCLLPQSFSWTFDSWPARPVLAAPRGPLRSVESIRVKGSGSASTALPATSWQIETGGQGRIALAGALPSPVPVLSGIAVAFTAGLAATPAEVPEALKVAVLLTLARLYENRGDAAEGDGLVPLAAQALAAPWRRIGA